MENKRCESCGGDLSRSGNFYICEYCGNRWEIDAGNDVHAVDRANAWSALRDGDFEKAARLFEEIVLKDSASHEAYWGRALACAGIVYVTDLNENKKVPTCNNITEDSFLKSKDVQKAISLAPGDIRDGYQAQAQQIERIRAEWLQKASKEPAYDIFISFKDSDRENGIERTQDSIDAQDLYNALVAEGYKVFFSRISLRDKISEQYEPYIYNAIKTAKVMIVFGEKPEYFSSVWIKNEWSRFKTRIEKGEKHKNSLVVVYKNLNPGDLPVVLKSRQCLNAADMTFLSDLTRHIKRVVAETQESARLDRIKIDGGQVAKKAASVEVNTIKTREIGQGALADVDLDNQQFLSLTDSYLKARQWVEAGKLIDEMLFNNPADAQAIWRQLLLITQSSHGGEFVGKLENFNGDHLLEKLLNTASKDFAAEILDLLYSSVEHVTDIRFVHILMLILPFNYPAREKRINTAFHTVTTRQYYQSFLCLLNTIDNQEVDYYIGRNLSYASKGQDAEQVQQCLNRILRVDSGNVPALRMRLQILLKQAADSQQSLEVLESLLKYTSKPQKELEDMIRAAMETPGNAPFIKQAVRYHEGKLEDMHQLLKDIAWAMLRNKEFDEAGYYCNLILSFDKNNPEIYWMLCLMKARVSSEEEITESDYILSNIPEFTKYLVMVSENRRNHCIGLAQKQKERMVQRVKELTEENKKLSDRYRSRAGCFKVVMIYGWIATALGLACLFIQPVIGILNLLLGLAALIAFYVISGKDKRQWKKDAPARKQKREENEAHLKILKAQLENKV